MNIHSSRIMMEKLTSQAT